jgi:antitoxin (DNA-binding transcriptional repressor) of toxin-antitoxin stability system
MVHMAKTKEKHVGVTDFKSTCLALIDDVARGKTTRIVLTNRNHEVAAIVPLTKKPVELWGAMKGTVKAAPGVDLTQPVGEEWEAER